MSQPAVSALAPLPFDLVYEDGEPLESEWHTWQFPLLRGLIRQLMEEHGRRDFYVGGNMFVYYSVEQARDVAQGRQSFRGPDVFWVGGVQPRRRKAWVAWEDGGRLPDVIVELSSPTTASIDRKDKKDLYARIFRTSEYYLYDPDLRQLEGFRLAGGVYVPTVPDAQGRLWSEQLGAFLGLWHGVYEDMEDDWVRLFRRDGSLVLTGKERAAAESRRAEEEHRRAEAESEPRRSACGRKPRKPSWSACGPCSKGAARADPTRNHRTASLTPAGGSRPARRSWQAVISPQSLAPILHNPSPGRGAQSGVVRSL